MATTIVTKYGSDAPAASDIVRGELAVDTENGRLYTENAAGAVVEIGLKPEANVDVTGTITASGEIIANGGIALGDSDKATFGVGDDLQIYHDGNHSYIEDAGTGSIKIKVGDFRVENASGNNLIKGVGDVATLHHAGAEKLATTATGIDVTGSVTADGITNNGDVVFSKSATGVPIIKMSGFATANNPYGIINFYNEDGSQQGPNNAVQIKALAKNSDGSGGELAFYTSTGTSSEGADAVERFRINADGSSVFSGTATMDGLTASASTADYIASITNSNGTDAGGGLYVSTRWNTAANSVAKFVSNSGSNVVANFAGNGDISFYEDTGTTAKLFWDASAESLGIGNSIASSFNAGANNLVIGSGSGSEGMTIYGGGESNIFFADGTAGSAAYVGRIEYAHSVDKMLFYVNNSQAMTIDSSGNVGIGGVPNSWSTVTNVLQMKDQTALVEHAGTGYLSQNWYYNAGEKYIDNGYAVRQAISSVDGSWSLGNAANNTSGAGAALSWQERMRIDASGNVLVGETADFNATSTTATGMAVTQEGRLTASRSGTPIFVNRLGSDGSLIDFWRQGVQVGSIGSTSGYMYVGGTAGSDAFLSFGADGVRPATSAGAARDAAIDLGSSTNRFKDLHLSGTVYAKSLRSIGATGVANEQIISGISGVSNGHIINQSAANELTYKWHTGANAQGMTFTNDGNLLVGGTAYPDGTDTNWGVNAGGVQASSRNTSSTSVHYTLYNSNGAVGTISTNSSSTTYNTSSDQRLKENIADADDAGSKVDAIQVRKFDWKADGQHQDYGMIAQELIEVAPEAVSAPEDPDEMMGVDYSKLVPMLIKEIQQLRQRVAQLEE